jgi:hypothetical protein
MMQHGTVSPFSRIAFAIAKSTMLKDTKLKEYKVITLDDSVETKKSRLQSATVLKLYIILEFNALME